jgi:hypothetical protein
MFARDGCEVRVPASFQHAGPRGACDARLGYIAKCARSGRPVIPGATTPTARRHTAPAALVRAVVMALR